MAKKSKTIQDNVVEAKGDLTTGEFANGLDHNVNMVSQCVRGIMKPPLALAIKLSCCSGKPVRNFYDGPEIREGYDLMPVEL